MPRETPHERYAAVPLPKEQLARPPGVPPPHLGDEGVRKDRGPIVVLEVALAQLASGAHRRRVNDGKHAFSSTQDGCHRGL